MTRSSELTGCEAPRRPRAAGSRRRVVAFVALALACALSACGAGSPPGSTTSTPGARQPGSGRPTVTLGSKSLPQYLVLGRLYEQALRAKGFRVELKQNIGSMKAAAAALREGQIDAYPEPVGGFDAALVDRAARYASLSAALAAGRAYAAAHGLMLLAPTPFADADALAVLPAYASQHRLASIADLARVPDFRVGARPEFRTHRAGLVGLREVYGIARLTYFPLTTGVQYPLLDDGHLDVAGVSSTDGQLAGGAYRLLADPRHLFGFQNVALVLRGGVLEAEGPAFEQTLAAVGRLLTNATMQQLVSAVAIDRKRPEDVARDFLATHRLG